MNCLSLNCRGLGNLDAVGGLRNLIRREAPAIVFLCETKLGSRDMNKIISKLVGYKGVSVDCVGRSGGLAFLWREEVSCTFRASTVHFMDFDVEHEGMTWRCTGFYGWPAVQDRHLSWRQLRLLAAEGGGPWLCLGDFNEVLFSTEMKGGTRAQWQMNNFRDAVDEIGLGDLPFEGYMYTFDNGQEGLDNRQCRLDRAMVNEGWRDLFPYAKLIHLDREWSDHAPIKVVFDGRNGAELRGTKKFRFEHIWVGEDGCEEAVRAGVGKGDGELLGSIEGCAKELVEWKGISIGRILRELNKKRRYLKKLNEGDRGPWQVKERRRVVGEISQLLRKEERFWRQRSRAIWLKDGDRNTAFFHRKAGQRKRKNFIAKLVDSSGRVVDNTAAISACAVEYFRNLFSTDSPSGIEEAVRG
ncbi:uncharacterized protein LOC141627823 [Silene latifolia]|uniref:uncharacterized protein LOC141627823 n=1 Tax=Silene latifolia TaxID=37657 RepID=UPI003D7767E4